MRFKCFILFGIFISAHAKSVGKKEIPVNIVYDKHVAFIEPLENKDALGVRNLQEKIQISKDDLLQSDKHLPLTESKPTKQVDGDLLKRTRDSVLSSFKQLRTYIDASSSEGKRPTEEEWTGFYKKLEDIIDSEKEIKEQRPEFLKKVAAGIQKASDSFGLNFSEKKLVQVKQGFGQNIFTAFQEGVQQIIYGVNPSQRPDGVAGDEGVSSTTSVPFFQNIGNQFSQVWQNFGSQNQNVSGDEGSSNQQGSNPFQQFISNNPFNQNSTGGGNLIQNFGNLFNGGQQSGQSDEGNQQGSNPVQGFGQQVQNFFQNNSLNQNAGGSGDSSTSNNVFANFGSQIINAIRPQGQSNQSSDEGTQQQSNNPFQGFGQQVSNVFNQITNNRPSNSSGDESQTQRPGIFQNIQNFFSQGQNNGVQNQIQEIGNQIQNGSNPLNQGSSSNPIVTQIQNFGNQIPGSSSAQGSQGDSTQSTTSSNPIIGGIQNFGNQINGLQGQNAGNTFVEQIQNQVQQFSNGSNPLQQIQQSIPSGSKTGEEAPISNEIETKAETPVEITTASAAIIDERIKEQTTKVILESTTIADIIKETVTNKEEIMVPTE